MLIIGKDKAKIKVLKQSLKKSTTEAEYYSLAKAISEALWLRQILDQIIYKGGDIKSVRLYGDN